MIKSERAAAAAAVCLLSLELIFYKYSTNKCNKDIFEAKQKDRMSLVCWSNEI